MFTLFYMEYVKRSSEVVVLHPVPMHVAILVPENQMKCKNEYRNTQQVQLGP
jgi:hypothetical protein